MKIIENQLKFIEKLIKSIRHKYNSILNNCHIILCYVMICYVGLCYAKPTGALVKTKRLAKTTTLKWYQVVQSKHRPNMT